MASITRKPTGEKKPIGEPRTNHKPKQIPTEAHPNTTVEPPPNVTDNEDEIKEQIQILIDSARFELFDADKVRAILADQRSDEPHIAGSDLQSSHPHSSSNPQAISVDTSHNEGNETMDNIHNAQVSAASNPAQPKTIRVSQPADFFPTTPPNESGYASGPALINEATDSDSDASDKTAPSSRETANHASSTLSISAPLQQKQFAELLKHISHQQRTLEEVKAYLSDKSRQTIVETQAQSGISSTLAHVAQSTLVVAGVSTVTLLAIGGLAPLLIPAATGTLTTTIAVSWLTNIGSNVLASWIQGWAEKHASKIFSSDPSKHTQELAHQMGPDLEADMRKDHSLASALANMLEKLDIRRIITEAIASGLEIRDNLVTRLRNELRIQQQQTSELLSITNYLLEQLSKARAQQARPGQGTPLPPNTLIPNTSPARAPPMDPEQQKLLETLFQDPLNE